MNNDNIAELERKRVQVYNRSENKEREQENKAMDIGAAQN